MNILLTSIAATKLIGDTGLPVADDAAALETVLKTSFVVIGALAVIFIMVGGLQYILSGGDPSNTNRAKETVLYAVIGLAVSLLAFGIVDFVIGKV